MSQVESSGRTAAASRYRAALEARRFLPRLAAFVSLGCVLLALREVLGFQWISVGTVAGFYALTAIGLELLWGLAGQVSLGQGAFMAIGAYSSALLTVNAGLPAGIAALLGLLLSCAIAAGLGRLVLQLGPIYLAIATMGFALVVPALIVALPGLTEGAVGVFGIPPIQIAGYSLAIGSNMYLLVWSVVLISAYGSLRIAASRIGLAWRLLGEHQQVAESVGVNLQQRKTQALILSAGFGSVSGSLYAHYTQVVSPVSFGFSLLLILLTIEVLGGLGTGYGPVVGAIIVGLVTMNSGSAGESTSIAFGAVFLVMLYAAPAGLVGVIRSTMRRLARTSMNSVDSSALIDKKPIDIAAELAELRRLLEAPVASTAPEFCLNGITKSFGGVAANTEVSLNVRGGEILGVIGPNGAGKSTAVNIATGVYAADSGTVSWGAEDISLWSTDRRAWEGVARTFQQPTVVPGMSVVDNVAVGAYRFGGKSLLATVFTPAGHRELERLRAAAFKALEIVGLDQLAAADSQTLSFGQRRLTELARALVSLPKVIFLDEPMSGLDVAEKQQIVVLLRGLKAVGVAVCIIEHDTETIASLSDRICVLDFGKVLCVGAPDDVFNDPRVMESYMGETVAI